MFVLFCRVGAGGKQHVNNVRMTLVDGDHQRGQAFFVLCIDVHMLDDEIIRQAFMAMLDGIHESRPRIGVGLVDIHPFLLNQAHHRGDVASTRRLKIMGLGRGIGGGNIVALRLNLRRSTAAEGNGDTKP